MGCASCKGICRLLSTALSSTGGTPKGHVPGTSHEAAGSDYDSDLCDSSSSGCHGTGGDQSEDSSLTDSERTLVGDDLSPRNNSPDLAEADGAEASLGPASEFVPSVGESSIPPLRILLNARHLCGWLGFLHPHRNIDSMVSRCHVTW